MNDLIDTEGFRANVAIVLLSDAGRVFLGRRMGGRGWQFPQGGVREGEAPEEAVYRELEEEVGLTATDVILMGSTTEWLRYRLPSRFVRRNQQPLCIGQKQRWFLFRVPDENVRIDLTRTTEPEFDQWRWVDFWEPVRAVIYFKRGVYKDALQQLAQTAFPGGAPHLPSWWHDVAASGRTAGHSAARRRQ